MKKRRNTDKIRNLCSGPGKLCMAMDITGNNYNADLCDEKGGLFLEYGSDSYKIETSKRINIDYAGEAKDWLLRFTAKDNAFLSK